MFAFICWGKLDPCMNSLMIYGEKVLLLLLERAAVCTQSLSLSFFLVLRSICTPTFHPHIKVIHHQDQNHCVSPRQPDLLVGFFCLWVLWLRSRARDTQIHFWQGLSLPNAASATFCAFPFYAECPKWIARPHVNVTFKANKRVSVHVAANQLLQQSSTAKHNSIHPRSS